MAQTGLARTALAFHGQQLDLILTRGNHWVFWALPVALVVVALFLLPVTPSQSYWLLGVMLTGAALGLSMAGIYYTIDPFARGYRRARLGMNALTYAVALVLFLVFYCSRFRQYRVGNGGAAR
jgi:hypothetical protein